MGEKDIIEKKLEAYNDVFADIVNALLFNGERVISRRIWRISRQLPDTKLTGKSVNLGGM